MLVRMKGLERLFPDEKDRILMLDIDIPTANGIVRLKRTGRVEFGTTELIEEFEVEEKS